LKVANIPSGKGFVKVCVGWYTYLMIKKILSLTLCLVSLSAAAFAGSQVITLKDGSQIKGDVTGLANDIYTISSPALGNITINKSLVASIADGSMPAPSSQTGASQSVGPDKIQAMQTQMMANPEFMADLQQMASDPEIMQMLSDPALVQAVTSKDTNALQGNPKAQQLMENAKFRALIEKLRGSGIASTSQ